MSRGAITHNYDYVSVCSSSPRYQGNRLSLTLRQQPVQARFSTSNERDRKPIEPPPIIQIQLKNASSQETQDFLQNPYFFMCVNLTSTTSKEEITRPDNRVLAGQTVSSMYKLKDVSDKDGGFFCFGDLSSRIEGEYRLKFTLFEIISNGIVNLMHTFSNVFKVYNSKTMPRSLDATFLSRSFSDQGVRIRIRKEHRVQVTTSRKRKHSAEDDSTSKSPTQLHVRDFPVPLLPTKRLSPTAPTSPTSASFFHPPPPLHYKQQQQQQQQQQGKLLNDQANLEEKNDGCLPTTRQCNRPDTCLIYQQQTHLDDNIDSVYQWRSFNEQPRSIPYSPPPQPYDLHSRQNSLSQQQPPLNYLHHSGHHHYSQYPSPTAMLSPPSAQLKLEQRRQSAEDKVISPLSPLSSISSAAALNHQPIAPTSTFQQRTSADTTPDWAYNQHPSLEPPQLTFTRQQRQPTTIRSPSPPSNAIRLPPLHTMVPSNNSINNKETKDSGIDRKNDVGEVNAAVAMMQLSRYQQVDNSHQNTPKYNPALPSSLSIQPQYNRQCQPSQYYYQYSYPYRHQHDQVQCSSLDPSRHATTGIWSRNSY